MLRVAALVSLMCALSMPRQPNYRSDYEEESAPQSQPAIVKANAPNEQPSGQENKEEAGTNSPEWYAALQRPDWWVVIVAGLTGCVIGWQSFETRRAAKASQLAAEATRKMLDSSIAKDRARLRVEVGELAYTSVVTESAINTYWIEAFVIVTHHGSTEALVEVAEAELFIADSSKPAPNFFAPSLGMPSVVATESEPHIVKLRCPVIATATTIRKVNRREVYMHLYGRILYRDVFSLEPRETNFYHLWFVDQTDPRRAKWVKQECDGYNRET